MGRSAVIELPSGRYTIVEEFGVEWPVDAPASFAGRTTWYSGRAEAQTYIEAFVRHSVPPFRGVLVHRWVATSSPSEVVDA